MLFEYELETMHDYYSNVIYAMKTLGNYIEDWFDSEEGLDLEYLNSLHTNILVTSVKYETYANYLLNEIEKMSNEKNIIVRVNGKEHFLFVDANSNDKFGVINTDRRGEYRILSACYINEIYEGVEGYSYECE